MNALLINRKNELDEESKQLKKIHAEKKLNADICEQIKISSIAISKKGSCEAVSKGVQIAYPFCL